MNKEILESKIAELLDISSEDKSLSFSIFKEKLTNYLQIGEAIKIEDIGVFQMKEKFSHSDMKGTAESAAENLTLLFSPQSDKPADDTLFINLELSDKNKDESEFNKEVFQLGIGKILVDNKNVASLSGSESSSPASIIEEKIDKLFGGAEIIKDFDLWEDHLKIKETTKIIEDDLEENSELPIDEDKVEKEAADNIIEDDFIELDDNELLDGYVEDNKFVVEDINNLTDDKEEKKEEELVESFDSPDELLEDIIEETDQDVDDFSDDELDSTLASNIEEPIHEDIPSEKSVIEEINIELEIEEPDGELEVELGSVDEKEIDNEMGDDVPSFDDDAEFDMEEEQLDELEEDQITEDLPEEKLIEELPKKEKRSFVYILLAAFLLIGAVSIYYLFFRTTTQPYEEFESNVENQVEESALSGSEETGDPNQGMPLDNDETDLGIQVPNENIDKTELETDEAVPVSDQAQDPSNYEENEVGENIFYDGYVYNVQVSSWKRRDVAEREVNKLIERGFPAFIIKAYIAKFDGTWHRVRIGPYTSLDEAKIAQGKIKQ